MHPTLQIWVDSEAMFGIPEVDEEKVYNSSENPKPPNNVRPMPCLDCSMQTACRADWNPSEGLECAALRTWYSTGNYKDSQIEHLLKRKQAA